MTAAKFVAANSCSRSWQLLPRGAVTWTHALGMHTLMLLFILGLYTYCISENQANSIYGASSAEA